MFGGILVVRLVKNRESEGTGPTKTFAGEKKFGFYSKIKGCQAGFEKEWNGNLLLLFVGVKHSSSKCTSVAF